MKTEVLSRLLFKVRSLGLLEPYAMKIACTVLRGERGSNALDLLDHRRLLHHSDGIGLDHPSRGHGQLRARCHAACRTWSRPCRRSRGCGCRKRGRTCRTRRDKRGQGGMEAYRRTPSQTEITCKIKRNGIQVTKKHRNVVQADTPVRHRIPLAVRRDNGMEHMEFLPLRGAAA